MMNAEHWRARTLAAAVFALVVLMCASVRTQAHEGIASSIPRAGSRVEQPITEVTIEFLGEIADDVKLTLLDPDENPLASATAKVSPTTVRIEFEPLTRKGTYVVQYQAQIASDDHLTIGAMSFEYGSSSPGTGAGAWVFVAVSSIVILAIGTGFSVRRHRQMISDPTTEPPADSPRDDASRFPDGLSR